MVRGYCSCLPQDLRPGCAHHEHELVRTAQFAGAFHHPLEQALTPVLHWQELEIQRAFVAGYRQYDRPFPGPSEEWGDAVAAHVRGHGDGVEIQMIEESLGIFAGGVPNVPAFGVRDDQAITQAPDVGHRALQITPARRSVGLIKCQVQLVGHGEVIGGLHDGMVEGAHGIVQPAEMFREQVGFRVQTHAQQAPFSLDDGDELLSGHADTAGIRAQRTPFNRNDGRGSTEPSTIKRPLEQHNAPWPGYIWRQWRAFCSHAATSQHSFS